MSKTKVYASIEEMPRAEHPTDLRFIDRTGEVFGKLTVLHHAGKKGHVRYWACRCTCAEQSLVVVADSSLVRGATVSCGCYRLERVRECCTSHGLAKKEKHHYLYGVYQGIIRRCTDCTNQNYRRYGGRGILNKFSDVGSFAKYVLSNLGERPAGFSLDRIDNNGHYEPGNLRWASAKEQARNTSRRRYITTSKGVTPLAEAAEQAGLDYRLVHTRITYRGWSVARALNTSPETTHVDQPT
jgi:hypothetical protein